MLKMLSLLAVIWLGVSNFAVDAVGNAYPKVTCQDCHKEMEVPPTETAASVLTDHYQVCKGN